MSDVARKGHEYFVILQGNEPARRGDCRDCAHLRGFVSWWCTSSAAKAAHGTNEPGRTDCTFWKEAKRA